MLVPRHATRHRTQRGFLRAGSGYVHYRRAGTGPAVVALHESPRSSLSLLPLMDALADRYTVIALDTPGYGYSDPLPVAAPQLADYTRVVGAVADAFGLQRFALYGTHTGAAIAAAFAIDAPERVTSLVLDGLGVFTAREREDFLQRYLTPFVPQWDGTHLAALWSRMGDLYRWFPWHERKAATRLATDPPSLDQIYETLEGFLLAGDGYRLGYRCAATFEAAAAVAALRVPTLLFARAQDLIAAHLDRVSPTGQVRIERLGAAKAAWEDRIRVHLGNAGLADTAAESVRADGRALLPWGEGFLHVRRKGAGEPVALVIPDVPGSSLAALDATDDACPGTRWTLDLPGCGASDPAPFDVPLVDAASASIAHVRESLALEQLPVIGVGFGAALAARHAGALVVAAPDWMSGLREAPCSAVVPPALREANGAAFLGSWYQLRDGAFYVDPASDPPFGRRDVAQPPSAEAIQARHSAMWTAPQSAALAGAIQAWVTRDAAVRGRLRILEGESA